jgi:CRISPR/Cas system-associated protein Cas10 (large subunit of type III CRISPR-Cas system)
MITDEELQDPKCLLTNLVNLEYRVRKLEAELEHFRLKFGKRVNYTCSWCGNGFTRRASAQRHIDSKHYGNSDANIEDQATRPGFLYEARRGKRPKHGVYVQ